MGGGSRRGTPTFFTGVGLHELVGAAGLLKLGGKPCELGQDLVDYADFGGEVVLVDVAGEESAQVAETADDEHGGLVDVSHGWRRGGVEEDAGSRTQTSRGRAGGLGLREAAVRGGWSNSSARCGVAEGE